MKNKAKIIIHKNNQLELFINDKKVENVVELTCIRNLYRNDTMKEIDITLLASEVEIINTQTGATSRYPQNTGRI